MEKYVDPRSISIFVEVCRQSSFSKAAISLGLPNSHVSRRVKELESSLGTQLINRSTRSFSLSEVGQVYAAKCAEALSRIDSANDYVESIKGEPQGKLFVYAPYELGTHLCEEFIFKFMKLYPKVTLEIVFKNRAELKDYSKSDIVLDVGVSFAPENFKRIHLTNLYRKLYTSPSLMTQLQSLKHPSEINSELLIGFHSEKGSISATNTVFINSQNQEEFRFPENHKIKLNSLLAMKNIAVSGFGIAAVAPFVVDKEVKTGQLVPVLEAWSSHPVPLLAVFSSTRSLNPKINVFLKELETYFL